MLYSGFVEERGIRCIWLAHSQDGASWTQVKTPLVEPVEGEGNDIYGPSLLQWQGRNFIVYQDHTAYRGGNVKYVDLDSQLTSVGNKGERYGLIDPIPDSTIANRYRECEFCRDGHTLYMYASASEKPRIIVYATAEMDDAKTAPNERVENDAEPENGTAPQNKKGTSNKRAKTKNVNSPSRKEKALEPREFASLDDILTGVELETVYETTFDQPLRVIREDELIEDGKIARELPKDIDWVLEGPAEVQVKSGRLHICSDPSGNCVLWNTREFPESFVAAWDFQLYHPQGLAIFFFAAQAARGGSIFTLGLPKRGGNFGKYTRGKIHCYHTSYAAIGEDGVPRGETHLKKDDGDENQETGGSVAKGPSSIDGKSGKPHRIRLAKLSNRIILEVDGKVSFDWTDDGEKGDAPYQSGQIGLRQMSHTIEASYGALKIQRVKLQPESKEADGQR